MLSLNFEVPDHVSQAGCDLLKRLLTDSPQKRASISEVMHHPWYMEGLPASALNMNDIYIRSSNDNSVQPVEDAMRIVEMAMKHPSEVAPPRAVTDDLIERAFEEEEEDETQG